MISVDIKLPNKIGGDISGAVSKSLWQASMLVRRDASKRAPYKTGSLRRSIVEKVSGMKATVGTNLVYAAIHEYGGTIRPKNAKALRFKVWGKRVTTKKVTIKKRPYLRPALKSNKQKITKLFAKNITDALGRSN